MTTYGTGLDSTLSSASLSLGGREYGGDLQADFILSRARADWTEWPQSET